MDNASETITFYFTWKGFRIGNFFPMYVEPTHEKQYDDEKGELISHPMIRVDVPNDPVYVDYIGVLTVAGARYCKKQLESIYEEAPQTHDDWDLEQADKADNDNFDEMFNS